MIHFVPHRHEVYHGWVATPHPTLVRGIGLLGATSANMLEMIGVGPFITIPVLLAKMNGPQAMLGWLLGALALSDGMVGLNSAPQCRVRAAPTGICPKPTERSRWAA